MIQARSAMFVLAIFMHQFASHDDVKFCIQKIEKQERRVPRGVWSGASSFPQLVKIIRVQAKRHQSNLRHHHPRCRAINSLGRLDGSSCGGQTSPCFSRHLLSATDTSPMRICNFVQLHACDSAPKVPTHYHQGCQSRVVPVSTSFRLYCLL
jgi:hypothetical protein